MKAFDTLTLDYEQCQAELAEFQSLLATQVNLQENRDILPFFRSRRHLSAFIGSRESEILRYDRLAFEYDLFGDFACDLAVADSVTRACLFVEFEDGAADSLFVQRGARATLDWSPRFEHGYSQIVDWFWKLDDLEQTDDFEARFGSRAIHYSGLLVIGRSAALQPREHRRLFWRQQRSVINSRHIRCLTFDQLAQHLEERLTEFRSASRATDSKP